MAPMAKVIGLEILVAGLSDAIGYFVDVLGFELAYRGPSREVPGETAVLDGGTVAITLLEPAASGAGMVADRSPRVTQLVFGAPGDGVDELVARMNDAGVATRRNGEERHFVPPGVASGILGFDIALTFAPVDG